MTFTTGDAKACDVCFINFAGEVWIVACDLLWLEPLSIFMWKQLQSKVITNAPQLSSDHSSPTNL